MGKVSIDPITSLADAIQAIPIPDKRPSEELMGIVPQPGDTCPMIDAKVGIVNEAVADLRRAVRDAGRSREDDEKKLSELIEEVERACRYLDDYDLEDVRDNVEAIREWGKDWKDLAKALHRQLVEKNAPAEAGAPVT